MSSGRHILNFCGCRGLSVTTENGYVYRRTCMWSLYSQPLFYSRLSYAFFFNTAWHCLPLISLCFVIFSLTLLLVLYSYAKPLYLMGIIFSPSPPHSLSLPDSFSFSCFFFFLLFLLLHRARQLMLWTHHSGRFIVQP